MVYFLILMTFITSFLVTLLLLSILFMGRLRLSERLINIQNMYSGDIFINDKRRIPFRERVIKPVKASIYIAVEKITPKGMLQQLEKKLKKAGYPFGLNAKGWMLLKFFLSVALPFAFLLLIYSNKMAAAAKLMLFAVFAFLCWVLPDSILKERAKNRIKGMVYQLPDILDLLVVSVEAGLSFDGALSQVIQKSKGPLTQEFNTVLNEIQLGQTRREALMNMSRRCDAMDISTFISSIVQADQLGISIGKILRVQAEQMRDKRRQRAREAMMKVPVKMIIPLVIFIFPTIFVIILGPSLIRISQIMFK